MPTTVMQLINVNMSLLKNSRFRFLFVISITFLILIFYFNRDHNHNHNHNHDHDHDVEIIKSSKSKPSTCRQSMIESDRFICESDEKWQSRRDFYSKQHERNTLSMNEYERYFYLNWLPEFQCHNETRIGYGDGGKWACDIEYLKLKPSCLVYSLGSAGEFAFERSVHERLPRCSIHTIDERRFECPKDVCTMHQLTIGDGKNKTKTLRDLMADLNHTNLEIDILKVDIESSEYALFHTLFSNNEMNRNGTQIYIRQILIEVHLDRQRIYETNALFYLFNSQNYVIYHRELNAGFPYYACEYGFLKLNRKFFRGHF
ncbi:unnamed protein product [Rotaria socialis]|uniref:Methyltransferase domain-containing protein n=1 Tax=Rotaria socialis TaxID=392032 RepID=A0A819W3T7_9BILA|nr:unnamed protein product [Rotaria socialis]CAF3638391.1 unnamed protein product [Rotaria socialis]CAF4117451.1 unnamed protein product [Rotaria socialis]CAF4475876.1 unnamed protein product [Rotaria socialis]